MVTTRALSKLATLKSDGTVGSWGSNSSGRLGDGTTTTRTSLVQVSSITDGAGIGAGDGQGYAWNGSGSLKGWGDNSLGAVGDSTNTDRTTLGYDNVMKMLKHHRRK